MIDMESLKVRCGRDEALLRELLEDFISRCENEVARLREAGDDLHRRAHKVKGLALNLSMPELRQKAAQVERSAGEGDTDPEEVDQLLQALTAACREAREILEGSGE
jgi:HPt (histidine-containing phosphotransfer) domain-containing protein